MIRSSRIVVSTDGEIFEEPFEEPPLEEEKAKLSIQGLEDLFSSLWLKEYQDLGECLLHALKRDEFSKMPFVKTQPYFIGTSLHPKNVATFNGHNIHISLILTKEVQENNNHEIYLTSSEFPETYFTFDLLHNNDYYGKAHGKITSKGQIKILKITNFNHQPIKWENLPIGTNLISSFCLNHPLPKVLRPYYKKHKDERSYVRIIDDCLEVKIYILEVPSILYIPIFGLSLEINFQVGEENSQVQNGIATGILEKDGNTEIISFTVQEEIVNGYLYAKEYLGEEEKEEEEKTTEAPQPVRRRVKVKQDENRIFEDTIHN